MHTPWGPSQDAYPIGDSGIVFHSCAGHGGLKVPPALNAQIHEAWRNPTGWYEEDCEFYIVAVTFHAIFTAWNQYDRDYFAKGAMNWFPDQYEKVFGVKVTGEQSYLRAKQEFAAAHADKWVAVSAYGSWQEGVPEGMVGVAARLGGRDMVSGDTECRHFLIPETEYESRGNFGFVVDPDRHQGWDFPAPGTKRVKAV